MSSPLRILILARDPSPRVQTAWEELCPFLEQRDRIDIVGVATSETPLEPAGQRQAELAVVLGGDGAILRACRGFGPDQIPILGVNLGRLGFLADLSPQEFRSNIEQIESRNFHVVKHLMFQCEHHLASGETNTYLGLNETAIVSAGSLSMIDIQLAIDGEPVTTYSGDGLIVSTPVGSTAHSLSAGGPLLKQDLDAFVVTPICSHSLTVRPLVDRADCLYELTVPDAADGVRLVIDGQIKQPLGPHDRVLIRRAPVQFQLVRIPGHSYYGTLHRKLGWHGQPRYQS